MHKFTLIINSRGWSVKDAIVRWKIRYATYNARCNNEKMHPQLLDMCKGLPYLRNTDGFTLGSVAKDDNYHYLLLLDRQIT